MEVFIAIKDSQTKPLVFESLKLASAWVAKQDMPYKIESLEVLLEKDFPNLIKRKKKTLSELEIGDKVWCGGDSGFTQDSIEKVKDVYVKYDSDTGESYKVIVLSDEQKFDSRNGWQIVKEPKIAMYYIETID